MLGIDEISSPFDVYALSLWLGTSYTATARQLGATRLLSMSQSIQWARFHLETSSEHWLETSFQVISEMTSGGSGISRTMVP